MIVKNYIYGAGGHGKVVLDTMQTTHVDCVGFVDDKNISSWMGLNVFSVSDLKAEEESRLHIAIGNSRIREAIAKKVESIEFFRVSHPTATISKSAVIGVGTFLAANTIVASGAEIGSHCIINHAAVIDHDCFIGNYSHIAPQSSLGGGVRVGQGVLVGAGAIILPEVEIEDYAVIGAGAVVTKNVAAGFTVVGNPARRMGVRSSL